MGKTWAEQGRQRRERSFSLLHLVQGHGVNEGTLLANHSVSPSRPSSQWVVEVGSTSEALEQGPEQRLDGWRCHRAFAGSILSKY
jgi:hypothetical protein